MADDTLIFDGADLSVPMDGEDAMNDVELNEAGEDVDFMDDGDEPGIPDGDDDDDSDFQLDGYDTLQIRNDDDEEEEYEQEEDDDDDSIFVDEEEERRPKKKTKSVRISVPQAKTRHSRRFTVRPGVGDAEPFILDDDNEFLNKPANRVPGTFGRRDRRKGESLPAYSKRVSHELDSDDELMMQMREKGFSDRQIADKLAKDGRVRYDQKSISTRIMRIRLAQAENVDFLLKEGYKEWEFEDDCILMQAYAVADIEVTYEIERIRAWRFRKVSEYMRRLNPDALFSANACRERYASLTDGTARIPTELDDDPDARRAEMEAYRESREAVRNKEKAEKAAMEAAERKKKQELKDLNAQKSEETANRRHMKEAEKLQRAMDRAAKAQIRMEKAEQNKIAKTQRNAQIQRKKQAEAEAQKKGQKRKRGGSVNIAASSVVHHHDEEEDDTDPTLSLTPPEDINADTPDPRFFLSMADLTNIADDRGIQASGKDQDQLVQELKDLDDEWTVEDLKKMCRTKKVDNEGNKAQLKYKLAMHTAKCCPSFAGCVAAALAAEEEEMEMDEE